MCESEREPPAAATTSIDCSHIASIECLYCVMLASLLRIPHHPDSERVCALLCPHVCQLNNDTTLNAMCIQVLWDTQSSEMRNANDYVGAY